MSEQSSTPLPSDATATQVTKEPSPPLPLQSDAPTSVPGVAVPLDTQMDLDPPPVETNKETTATVTAASEVASSSKNESVDKSADANGSTSTPVTNPATTAAIVPEASSSIAPGPSNIQSIDKPSASSTVTSDPPASTKPKFDWAALPTRQYLDQTVVPILLAGLSWLAKTRPEDPVEELSKYLIDHKSEYEPQSVIRRNTEGTASSGITQSK